LLPPTGGPSYGAPSGVAGRSSGAGAASAGCSNGKHKSDGECFGNETCLTSCKQCH
jgi:hypothetical protein